MSFDANAKFRRNGHSVLMTGGAQNIGAYAEKSLERARKLNARGGLPLTVLLNRDAHVRIARSNDEKRQARLDKCRTALFLSFEEIMAICE